MPSHQLASASPSAASTRPPGNTCAPPMNAVSSWRRTMKTSGPAGPSRSTTTVAAGRAFATITGDILVDDAFVLGHGPERPDRGTAARFRGDSNVEAEHVGLQARRLGDPRARRSDRT